MSAFTDQIFPSEPTFGSLSTGDQQFLTIAMYTREYKSRAERLALSLKKQGISHAIFEVPEVHVSISLKGGKNLTYSKPNFIGTILAKVKCPVLYIDADCEVLKPLSLIDKIIGERKDFAIYNWLTEETNTAYTPVVLDTMTLPYTQITGSGISSSLFFSFSHKIDFKSNSQIACSGAVQFWNLTNTAKELLEAWFQTISLHPEIPDDVSLDFTWNNKVSRGHNLLNTTWLPKHYARIAFWIFDDPIINHNEFPSEGKRSLDFNDPLGRQRVYANKCDRKENKILIPLGTVLQVGTGDIFIFEQNRLSKIAKIGYPIYL